MTTKCGGKKPETYSSVV